MSGARLISVAFASALLVSCSSSGKSGSGAEDGMGEGNIPVASPGSELKDARFAFDSSALDSSAQSALKENARWLNDNPSRKVVVEGHCDERGTSEYNLALGERRSRAAYDYLRSLGVSKDRMSTISYGEELPLDPGHDEGAWAQNRRAHFSLK